GVAQRAVLRVPGAAPAGGLRDGVQVLEGRAVGHAGVLRFVPGGASAFAAVDDEGSGVRVTVGPVVPSGLEAQGRGVLLVGRAARLVGHAAAFLSWMGMWIWWKPCSPTAREMATVWARSAARSRR